MKSNAVYVGNDRVLLRSKNGYKMFADARDISITPHLILEGVYEEHTDAVLKRAIRPGMSVLEIGANVGLFTLLMSHRVRPNGRVLAFECDPMLAQILRDNIELNGFADVATAVERAVSDRQGTLRFFSTTRHRGGGTLVEGLEQLPGMADERVEVRVESTTVNDVLRERGHGFDFVKIDAEGAESSIFAGGEVLFADRARPLQIMVEFAPDFMRGSGADPSAFLERLSSWGFSFARIDERKRKAMAAAPQALLSIPFSDLLLTRT